MPPKKKEGKSKSKKKGKPDGGNGDSAEEVERLAFLEKATSLTEEIEKEKALTEQFQRHSELLKQYWEIEKKSREERKRSLLEKDQRLKELKDKHSIELGEYKHTIKQQLFSNQDELSQNVTQSLLQYQSVSTQHHHEIGLLINEVNDISNRIKETNLAHEEFKKAMQHNCGEETTELREETSRKIANLASYSEKQLKGTREELDMKLKEEMKDVEKSNEGEIRGVMEKIKEEIQQIRRHYNVTINSNLDIITKLKKELQLLKEHDHRDRKILNELRSKNSGILVPLTNNKKELVQLDKDLTTCQKQKQELDTQKKKLRDAEDELKEIEWNHEVLFQKLQALEYDRDEWKQKYQDSIYSAQQRSNFKNLMLERKLGKLSLVGDKNMAALGEILRKSNVELDSFDKSDVKITDVIKERNEHVAVLDEELKRVNDAHAAMMKKFQELVEKYTSSRAKKLKNSRSLLISA